MITCFFVNLKMIAFDSIFRTEAAVNTKNPLNISCKCHLIISGDNYLYLAGGEFPDGSASRSMWRFDQSLDSWMEMVPMNMARSELGTTSWLFTTWSWSWTTLRKEPFENIVWKGKIMLTRIFSFTNNVFSLSQNEFQLCNYINFAVCLMLWVWTDLNFVIW